MFKVKFIFGCIVFFIFNTTHAQLVAFPGAEGAGAYTTGGRGTLAVPTTVFEVTNLSDVNSPGSLRYAVSASAAYRTIVFRVSGTIHLTSKLNIKANTTIAGQTAPGDGICIADYPVVISGDNVILRYLRIRMGDKNELITTPAGCGIPVAPFTSACMPVDGSGGNDALGNLGNKNIIIDHCSVSWSTDEALTVYRGDSITLQWNFIEEPLNYSWHFETGDTDFEHHGFGGIWGAKHGSFHHNLFAHTKSRNPRFAGNSTYNGATESADFRNNVIYNWELFTVYGGEGGEYNLVNNYYKYGPNTSSSTKYRVVNVDSSAAYPFAKYFLSGNYVDGSSVNTANNWSGALMMSGKAADTVKSKVTTPFLSGYLPSFTQTAVDAYDTVLKAAGAVLPRRDTLDKRVVNDVKFRVGRIIDVQGGYPHATPYAQTVKAWPTLNSTAAPLDTDHDGMPDNWETANGLNPNNAADRQYIAANGYTNLENYLNGISNTAPDINYSGVFNTFSQIIGSASAVQTINITADRLNGNLFCSAPNSFEISADGGNTWVANQNVLSVIPTNGTSSFVLSVRLNAAVKGNYNGVIKLYTAGIDTLVLNVTGVAIQPSEASNILIQWPLTVNNTDNAMVRSPGVLPTVPRLNNLVLSNGTSASGVTSYSTTHGQAFAASADGYWTVAVGGPGANLSRNHYEEFVIRANNGYSVRVDSLVFTSAFYNTSSNTKFAAVYSKSAFVADSADVMGGVGTKGFLSPDSIGSFSKPIFLANQTSTLTNTYSLILDSANGVKLNAGDSLTIRLYYACGSTSSARYAKLKNVYVTGLATDVLPLELVSFTGKISNQSAVLNIVTANENNAAFLIIERSLDALTFNSVGKLTAQNKQNNFYEFTHADELKPVMYYRLKLVDKDGSFTYSKTIRMIYQEQNKMHVFPNPANGIIQVAFQLQGEPSVISLLDLTGKTIATYPCSMNEQIKQIDISRFTSGAYILQLQNTKNTITSYFIKQ